MVNEPGRSAVDCSTVTAGDGVARERMSWQMVLRDSFPLI